jgi:predicted nucleic acid-binding protein
MAFTAVLDANVLYPASQRDLLVRLAQQGLYRGRWSALILDEMERGILRRQPELATRLTRTRSLMSQAVDDCLVTGHEPLIDSLVLPDPDDRHVLAAAIRCGAEVIVTNNIRDFPQKELQRYEVEAQRPDEFLVNIVDLAPAVVIAVLQQQALALMRPPQTLDQLIGRLASLGLEQSMELVRSHADPQQ